MVLLPLNSKMFCGPLESGFMSMARIYLVPPPWKVSGEVGVKGTSGSFTDGEETQYTAKDIRFTTSKDKKNLYAIFLEWPKKLLVIESIKDTMSVVSVTLLGSDEPVEYGELEDGLKVKFQKEKPTDYAHVLKG